MSRLGILLCLASATGFGAMGVLGKLAYGEGATVGTLLAARFVLAAGVLWLLAARLGVLTDLRAASRRDIAAGLTLGAIGYGAQAGAYFAALERLDAGLVALLVYTYPVVVTIAAVRLGRERGGGSTVAALVLASTGLVLVLAGARAAPDALGVTLALTAALVYSVYVLTSHGVATRVRPLALTTLVCTGAGVSLTLTAILRGDLDPGAVTGPGLACLAALALVSTVGAVGLFLAGLHLVGPTAASILSTLEPVVAAGLAALTFGDRLGPAQLLGTMLVVAAALTTIRQEPACPAP